LILSRISQTFAALRPHDRLAFMPFITAGDPGLAMTQTLLRKLGAAGVDLIEIGFPYSDPIADGPVIQASYTRALAHKLHVSDIFAGIAELKNERLPPLVAMVSYAIIFRTGGKRFVAQAKDAGFSGLIVPDLPGDEAADLFQLVRGAELDLIQLVAPTTPRVRAREILKACSGFVYCVAVAGTTGVREQVASELLAQLRWMREETDLPLCVGFGISKPEHLEPLRGVADGAIVGSGIVRHLQDVADGKHSEDQAVEAIDTFAVQMTAAAHRS
jgi:tryptophan synthase alpha chain